MGIPPEFQALWPKLLLSIGVLCGGCGGGYIAQSIYFQGELLAYRVPLEAALEDPRVSPSERKRIRLTAIARKFARKKGLVVSQTYTTVALHWPRTLANITACPDDSLQPVTWTFPLVGEVPYLGFFRKNDLENMVQRIEQTPGIETSVREVTAYSTLGYFDDPILPNLLRAPPLRLLEVLFHELAHSTVWLNGSVRFNESFASFVGEQLTVDFLEWAGRSNLAAHYRTLLDDREHFASLMLQVTKEAEEIYSSPRSRSDKLQAKEDLFAGLAKRVNESRIVRREVYIRYLERSTWNNAALVRFRAYNELKPHFRSLYEEHGGELSAFIAAVSAFESEDDFMTHFGRGAN